MTTNKTNLIRPRLELQDAVNSLLVAYYTDNENKQDIHYGYAIEYLEKACKGLGYKLEKVQS